MIIKIGYRDYEDLVDFLSRRTNLGCSMREKVLKIIEEEQAEIERLEKQLQELQAENERLSLCKHNCKIDCLLKKYDKVLAENERLREVLRETTERECSLIERISKWDKEQMSGVAPVVHAHWIDHCDEWIGDSRYTCSVCGEDWTCIYSTPYENNMNYCPACGARMDEEEN